MYFIFMNVISIRLDFELSRDMINKKLDQKGTSLCCVLIEVAWTEFRTFEDHDCIITAAVAATG